MDQIVINYNRLARIWTPGEHLDLFYKMKADARDLEFPDEAEMQKAHDELVEKLQCKNMSWYLDNVDHEMKWEMDKICLPNAPKDHPDACKGQQAWMRSTVDELMKGEDFQRAQLE